MLTHFNRYNLILYVPYAHCYVVPMRNSEDVNHFGIKLERNPPRS